MVPSGVNELKLNEAGFMFNNEKNIWYHQGTEFGRRKAENEEKSVEKLVSYLEVCLYKLFEYLDLLKRVRVNLLLHSWLTAPLPCHYLALFLGLLMLDLFLINQTM